MRDIFEKLLDQYNDGISVTMENTILIKSICYEYGISEGDVLAIIKKLKTNEGEFDISNEIRVYKRELNSRRKHVYTLIIPINCLLSIKVISIYGVIVNFKSGNIIRRDYGDLNFKRYKAKSSKHDTSILSYQENYMVFNVEGYTFWNALVDNFKIIETLSGIMNYAINDGSIVYGDYNSTDEADFSMGTVVYSINSLTDECEYVNWVRLTRGIKAKRRPKKLDRKVCIQAKKIAKIISNSSSKNSISEMISSCFRMYYYAESAVHKYDRFMHFWRICETISMSEKFGGQTKIVSARIAKFIVPVDGVEIDQGKMIRQLAKIRNDFVHRGLFNGDDNDINILKIAVDNVLFWIIKYSNQISTTNELEFYYKVKDSSNKDLNYMKNIIDLKLS